MTDERVRELVAAGMDEEQSRIIAAMEDGEVTGDIGDADGEPHEYSTGIADDGE